jgi:hypothetical protein
MPSDPFVTLHHRERDAIRRMCAYLERAPFVPGHAVAGCARKADHGRLVAACGMIARKLERRQAPAGCTAAVRVPFTTTQAEHLAQLFHWLRQENPAALVTVFALDEETARHVRRECRNLCKTFRRAAARATDPADLVQLPPVPLADCRNLPADVAAIGGAIAAALPREARPC